MQTVYVMSKANAMKIMKANSDSYIQKFCTGKYKWTGSAKYYLNRELNASDHILATYVERRQDSHGAYACIMCVTR